MTATLIEAHANALQVRFDHLITQMRLVETQTPAAARGKVREVIDELVRIRRDLSGLEGELPPPPSHAPGRRQMGAKRPCAAHNGGAGKNVSASRFRPGKDVCRECERREIRIEADRITLTLLEGDACIGEKCHGCFHELEAGDRVVGSELKHEACAQSTSSKSPGQEDG